MRGGARRRRLDGAGRLGGGGKRRRGCSGEDWARGSGLGAALGRGTANGGGYWGGAGLWWRLRGGGELAGVRGGAAAAFRGVGARGKQKREREESHSGGFVGLGRSLEECGGRCPGLSTATARWRPPGRLWKRRGAWLGREGSSARQQEGEEERRDAWVTARGEVMAGMAGKALHGAGVGAVGGRRQETEQGGGGGRKGRFCNFQKFQGLICKPAITFKPKLKWKSAQHESCLTFQDLQL